MLPPLAHGQSVLRPLEGGIQTQWWKNKFWSPISSCGLKYYTKYGKNAPHELDMRSTFKQLEDKHCNLDQGQIGNK